MMVMLEICLEYGGIRGYNLPFTQIVYPYSSAAQWHTLK